MTIGMRNRKSESEGITLTIPKWLPGTVATALLAVGATVGVMTYGNRISEQLPGMRTVEMDVQGVPAQQVWKDGSEPVVIPLETLDVVEEQAFQPTAVVGGVYNSSDKARCNLSMVFQGFGENGESGTIRQNLQRLEPDEYVSFSVSAGQGTHAVEPVKVSSLPCS